MKNKPMIPKRLPVPKEVVVPDLPKLPDPPLIPQDCPNNPNLIIPRSEILAMVCAWDTYKIARADYEKKRASVTLQLLLGADPDPDDGGYQVELNQKGGIILTDHTGIPITRQILGEGNDQAEFLVP